MNGRRIRFPVGGMLSGALAGLGVLVLLQQFGAVYPSTVALLVAVVGGALLAFAIVNLVGMARRQPSEVPVT